MITKLTTLIGFPPTTPAGNTLLTVGQHAHGLDEHHDPSVDSLLTSEGELSHGRDFHVYTQGLDASLGVKIDDIAPWVLPEGMIVDKGCGTGALLAHLSILFPHAHGIGMDLSRELLRIARSQNYPNHNVRVVRSNIIKRRFPAGSVSTAIFSTSVHEIYSYNGYDRDQVRLALANAHTELETHGRLIIRDGVKPEAGTVWMKCEPETLQRFYRFAREFKGMSLTPGVKFTEHTHDGEIWIALDFYAANEFLSKKDYLKNWAIEVNEEFGVWTLAQWHHELVALGYRILEARAYVNPWILANRYQGKVWLKQDDGGKPGKDLPFPATTMVIVAEKLFGY